MRVSSWAEANRRSRWPVVTREGDRNVIWLVGEQDMGTVPALARVLEHAFTEDAADIVIDLSQTSFIDAAIIGECLRARARLLQASRNLSLRAPSELARRVLRICELTSLIDPAPAQAPKRPDAR